MRSSFWKIPVIVAAVLLFGAPAFAQATRTWVSGVGDDANPCSRTAPCKTFAGSISKTAAGGEINCIDPGGFGAVTITKSIAIICDNTEAGVLVSGTNAIIINTAATDTVVLSGLDLEGLGTGLNGISFLNGGRLHIKNTIIRGFATNGISFTPALAGSQLVVQDSVISDNPNASGTGGGVLVKPGASGDATATLTNVHMDRSKFGLRVEDRSVVSLINCTATGNQSNGILAVSVGAVAQVTISGSTISSNGTNGLSAVGAAAQMFVSHTTITGNATGVNPTGGTINGSNPGTNTVIGNTVNGAFNGTFILS